MKKINCSLVFLILFNLIHSLAAADFSVKQGAGLEIEFAGKKIVASEEFFLRSTDSADENLFIDVKRHFAADASGRPVENIFGSTSGIDYRREFSLSPDGKELELAYMASCLAYNEHLTGKTIVYQLRLPLEAFAGCSYTVLTGRSRKLESSEGTIKANHKGRIGPRAIRQIAFKLGDWELVIDGNPKGVNSHGDYPPNAVVGLWDLTADGKDLILSRIYTPKFFGGMIAAHLVMYRGNMDDFNKRHGTDSYAYYSDLLPEFQYVFAAEKFGEQYKFAGTELYTEQNGFGWLNNSSLQSRIYRPQGAFYAALFSKEKSTFKLSSLRSGVHIFTLVSASADAIQGPFNISCNGKVIAKNLTLPAKTVQTVTFPVWVDNGSVEFEFSGDWCLSTLSSQLLLAAAEDYSFRRGFWRQKDIFEPSVLFGTKVYAKEPNFTFSVSQYPLPEPGQEFADNKKAWEFPTSHAEFEPGKDWRGRSNIGSLGPSNNGSFMEFNTSELIDKRLQELKEDNLNVILVNGLLSRHTYPSHLPRVAENIAEIVKRGRPLGMKFIDHQDYSLLWDMECGFRTLVENMPHLQQSADGQLTVRGFCASNEEYRKIYLDYLIDHVKKTDVDGLMLDEVSFHGPKYCACADCRKAFTRDTGSQLPADELSPVLFNRDSELWRTWLRWRQKQLGDFRCLLKAEIKKLRKDFVVMGYTTHYGMTSTYGSLNQGGAMQHSTRSTDFFGTEIMTRNIYANYRSVMSLRRAKAQLTHSSDVPVFGLVYTVDFDWDLMYFGWALNNMLGQATWEMTGHHCPADKSNYRLFTTEKGNIDLRESKLVSKIALLFSLQSRDWPRFTSYFPDVLGISQLLNLQHIPHVFINEFALNAERLSNYEVLIVSNSMALSDNDIAAIRAFAEQGGRVYLSNRVACYNENGDKRDNWPFADLIPLDIDVRRSIRAQSLMKKGSSKEWFADDERHLSSVRTKLLKDENSAYNTEWLFKDPQNRDNVALYSAALGEGKIYYSPLLLGTPAHAPEIAVGKEFTFERFQKNETIALQILQDIVQDANSWQPIDIPEQVLTSISIDKGETVIHFLNATGSNLKKGDMVSRHAPKNAFPELKKDLSFAVKLKNIQRAYAVSADFAGEKELAYKKMADGSYKVTLPAEFLKAYTLVRIGE